MIQMVCRLYCKYIGKHILTKNYKMYQLNQCGVITDMFPIFFFKTIVIKKCYREIAGVTMTQ